MLVALLVFVFQRRRSPMMSAVVRGRAEALSLGAVARWVFASSWKCMTRACSTHPEAPDASSEAPTPELNARTLDDPAAVLPSPPPPAPAAAPAAPPAAEATPTDAAAGATQWREENQLRNNLLHEYNSTPQFADPSKFKIHHSRSPRQNILE